MLCRLVLFNRREDRFDVFSRNAGRHTTAAGDYNAALVRHRIESGFDAAFNLSGSALCKDVPRGDVAEQSDGIVRQILHLGQCMVGAEVEQIHADLRKIRCTNEAGGIIVKEFHGHIERLENAG